MQKFSIFLAQGPVSSTPKDIHGTSVCALHRTACRLARIHEAVPGESIPREVMDFYKAMKGRDDYRPRMVKEAVLGIKKDTRLGIKDRITLAARHRGRMANLAKTHSRDFLEAWLQVLPNRQKFLTGQSNSEIELWRTAYLNEAMEIFEDTFDYIESLSAYSWGD
jgi:hypothetical protein